MGIEDQIAGNRRMIDLLVELVVHSLLEAPGVSVKAADQAIDGFIFECRWCGDVEYTWHACDAITYIKEHRGHQEPTQ